MTGPANEVEQPDPPRFHYLKRLALAGVLVFAGLVALHFWWSHLAQRRMDTYVNELHAKGRRILARDFISEPVPDEQNAGKALREAAQKVVDLPELHDWEVEFTGDLPFSANDIAQLRQISEANREALAKARSARSLPRVNWGITMTSPAMSILLPHLNEVRRVGNLTRNEMLYQHVQGNEREAIELARDLIFQCRCMDETPIFLISHLVSVGMHALVLDGLEQLTPELRMGGGERAATEASVRGLIADLSDERLMVEGASVAWQGEQMMRLDGPERAAMDSLPLPVLGRVLAPMFRLDALSSARELDLVADAVMQPTYAQARALLPGAAGPMRNQSLFYVIAHNLSMRSTGVWTGRLTQMTFEARARRKVVATALAVKLYQKDHAGALPATLDELVPRYLPAVPVDPTSAASERLLYRADGPDPIVYARGSNQRDDGGAGVPTTAPANRRTQPLDLVVHLMRRPTTAPAN
ncbi:MAG TPA: hypothetical protein VF669_12700 [Tepidisphaeraceae bacterium]|jgi:hypothetical protein